MELFGLQIAEPGLWGWWVAGAVLLAVELLLPGILFFWLGLAAFATGLIVLGVNLSWQLQIITFAVLAVISVGAGRLWQRRHQRSADEPALNRRAEQYIGARFVLTEPIVGGRGRAAVGDSSWRVTGPDLPAGSKVKAVGVDGTALIVEPLP